MAEEIALGKGATALVDLAQEEAVIVQAVLGAAGQSHYRERLAVAVIAPGAGAEEIDQVVPEMEIGMVIGPIAQ